MRETAEPLEHERLHAFHVRPLSPAEDTTAMGSGDALLMRKTLGLTALPDAPIV
jgi:hypothetical protein